MDFSGIPNNQVINNIFSGWYSLLVDNGNNPHLYSFSNSQYPISNFQAPYDARLDINTGDNFNKLIAVGLKVPNPTNPSFSTNLTGTLYYFDDAEIYGVCHGFGRNSLTYFNGYNFYNAHYAPGYFSPPFGENLSILQYNSDGTDALLEGMCTQLSLTEYNEIYGINAVVDNDAPTTADDLVAGQLSLLATPKAACPPEDSVGVFFDEVQLHPIQGTTTQLGANNLFNSNPIPTSLDNYEIRLSTRYSTFTSGVDISGNPITYINFANEKPVAGYSYTSQQNKLNTTSCPAQIVETSTSLGIGTNGIQLLIAADEEQGAIGSQTSFIGVQDPWNLWHFQFQENSEAFPFFDDYSTITNTQEQLLQSNDGTQIFSPVLSLEASYWQDRQCPSTVDYLPWTFGASIFACPSDYFDVPYYAATNKFGFYGMRFFNNCTSVDLQYPWSGVPFASEMAASTVPVALQPGEIEPYGIDKYGSLGGFSIYDNLLAIAKQEASYSDMYALNKGFFIWGNDQYIQQTNEFAILSNNYNSFNYLYSGLVSPFYQVLSGNINGYTKFEPNLIQPVTNVTTSSTWASEILLTNDVYLNFYNNLTKLLTGSDLNLWNNIENNFAYYVTDGQGNVNNAFYENIITGRDARLLTRYFEGVVKGNPIDLFPLNKITFSFDKASDYLTHTGWNRLTTSFGLNSPIPEVNRRFFVGAYANGQNISGVLNVINQINTLENQYYYPGFFNDINIGKDSPTPYYVPVNGGLITDQQNRNFSPSGWMALGLNGIGKLDADFSCFTPIFIQQPLDIVSCKIGQSPTLRALAVDYHTIPEDKMASNYQELIYWMYKLKMVDSQLNNLYPLQYIWYRVPTNQYQNFLKSGDFTLATQANQDNWGCMEGNNSANCTIINPLECMPTGNLNTFDNYTYVQGITKGVDDIYTYFCLASGRFGIRLSDPTILNIENWVRFDVSVRNAANSSASVGLSFIVNDYNGDTHTINFPGSIVPAYNGFQYDPYTIVEQQLSQKIPPPNAGYGDVSAIAPVGPIGYIGTLRSYTPSFLNDTRGLRETWGQMIDYGTLVPFYMTLSQDQGNLLYGYSHLPTCTNYQMNNGQAGIQILPTMNDNQVLHWTLNQRAVASFEQTYYGVPWNQLNTYGALYPPISFLQEDYESVGVGQWQWYNNLGAIKRFGYLSTYQTNDIVMIGNGSPSTNDEMGYNTQIAQIKTKWIRPTTLAGSNCGYTPFGMGRNMIFYIEAFDRFYSYCDPLKKKNIQDLNYMNPGIRMGNSAIQYSWLGQPSNTYLERRPMYGPYAYQWRVQRHNRDRNGNGISLGFWSMGYESPYTLMYDAPAIYGLYAKQSDVSPSSINQINNVVALRQAAGFNTEIVLRNNFFGTTNGEGGAVNYGNIFVDTSIDSPLSEYYSAMTNIGQSLDFENYACTQDMLQKGQCFDPCLSIRYGQGFFPGGKTQNLFGVGNAQNKTIKLTAVSASTTPSLTDEQSTLDKTVYFRPPTSTPYSKLLKSQNNQVSIGVSPCNDFGSDHCNYITPTIHLGTSSFLQGSTTSFNSLVNYMESIVGDYSE